MAPESYQSSSRLTASPHKRPRWWVRSALDLLCPPACLLCGCHEVLHERKPELCRTCHASLLKRMHRAYCSRCGQSSPAHGLNDERCGNCRSLSLRYDRVLRVGAYAGTLRRAVQGYKFQRKESLGRWLVRHLARELMRSDIYESIDAVVPVPTCWQHRIGQPFYPATMMARQISRRARIPLAAVLARRWGPRQTGASATRRFANVRDRFYVARGCSVRGATLCLVDDVLTTGATAGACARALKLAGAAHVYVAVLAHAGEDRDTLAFQ